MQPTSAPALAALRKGRVLFLHQSVGANVLSGIRRLDEETKDHARLRICSLEEATRSSGPMLIDVTGGRNGDPRSKIDFFASVIREQPRVVPDLALMKLCHVDFNPRTDVNELFGYYRTILDALRQERPKPRFAHVTVPLVVRPRAPKWRIFRLLGKEVWEDAANARRAEFNGQLEEAFGPDAVFDLARTEATAPDGRLTTFQLAGRSYPSLYPGYAADEGHLNEAGQRVAGAAAIDFLGRALRAASTQG